MTRDLLTIGWREWLALPQFGVDRIKVKVDTGARTSSLHAFDVHVDEEAEPAVVRFKLHPLQRSSRETVECEAPLLERRWVRSSNGKRELRPVIETPATLFGETFTIEITLTSRDIMGFRMLLGREAVRGRFLVNAGRSFLTTRVKNRKTGMKSTALKRTKTKRRIS